MIAFIVIAFFSETLGTLSGFGASAFFLPAAIFFGGFQLALGLTGALHTLSNLIKIWLFRSAFPKKEILHWAMPAVLFTLLGAYLISYVNSTWAELALGFLLVALPPTHHLIDKMMGRNHHRKRAWLLMALSGFTTGLLGSGGALRGSALSLLQLRPTDFVFVSAWIDLFGDLFRTIIYYQNGFFEISDLTMIPFLFLAALGGVSLGKLILSKFSQNQFQLFVQSLIFLSGLSLIVKSLVHLLSQ